MDSKPGCTTRSHTIKPQQKNGFRTTSSRSRRYGLPRLQLVNVNGIVVILVEAGFQLVHLKITGPKGSLSSHV